MECFLLEVFDFFTHPGQTFHGDASVIEQHFGHDVDGVAPLGRVGALLLCEGSLHRDVPPELSVDVNHYVPEAGSVRRHVAHSHVVKIIMYHLVQQEVVNLLGREVVGCRDGDASLFNHTPGYCVAQTFHAETAYSLAATTAKQPDGRQGVGEHLVVEGAEAREQMVGSYIHRAENGKDGRRGEGLLRPTVEH